MPKASGRGLARARSVPTNTSIISSRTAARLSPSPIARRQKLQADAVAGLSWRQDQAISRRLDRLRGSLTQADRLLATLSHKAVLARGFALVKDADGAVIKRAEDVVSGSALLLEFADGIADAVATSGTERPKPTAKPATKAKAAGGQGSLF